MRALITSLLFVLSTLTFAIVKTDDITTNTPSKTAIDFKKTIDIQTTNGMYLPNGTTAQRPSPYKDGMLRYNSDLDKVEVYANGAWQSVGGGISDWETGKDYAIGDVVIEGERIYQCLIAHTSGTFATDLANGDWIEVSAPEQIELINQSTGVLSGATLTVDVDPTKFDMAALKAQIVDSSVNGVPARNIFECPAFNAQTVTNLATQDVTYILVDATCTITQQATFPTAAQRRAKAFVGRLNHSNRTSVLFANTIADYLQSPMSQVYDLMNSLGAFNIGDGNKISANGANLSMDKSAGEMFVASYNYATDNQSPNNVTNIARTAFGFRYATQTTLSGSNVTVLDPTNYDNAGTITSIGGGPNTASVQRVYLFPSNNITVQYGQATYLNLAAAIQGISSESFVVTPTSKGLAIPIAYIAIQKNCTSLLDTTCSKIIATNIFGASAGVAGGTTNLQQAYDNSSQPQITTDATRGSMEFKRGSAADTDDVVRVLNGSGTKTASITGAGVITGANLSGTNTGDTEIGNDAGNIGVAKEFDFPNSQIVQTDSTNKKFRIESGNNNELYNGGFEAETLAVGWTISNATSSSSTTRIEGSKSLSLALTGALSLSQSSTINAAQKSGVQMVASIWVNSSDVSDLRLCSLKSGVEDKCTVTGGYVQGSGWRQLTVSFLGDSTSNGLKLKSTDTTGTVLVDQAYVGIGSPIVDFTPDMAYSAKVSSTGVVTAENTNWIQGDCTNANPTVCTLVNGLVTVPMNCTATSSSGTNWSLTQNNGSTATTLTFYRIISSAASSDSFNIICQKQGADYKTSKAYVASSSDFGYTNAGAITITATTTNPTKGTVVTDRIFASRDGQRLKAIYQYNQSSAGSAGSGDYIISLPSGLSFDTTLITPYTGSLSASVDFSASLVGYAQISNAAPSTTQGFYRAVAYSATSFRLTGMSAVNGGGITVAQIQFSNSWLSFADTRLNFNVNIDAPIQGWTDSGVIVGSFQGYNETPGVSRPFLYSVSIGGASGVNSVCNSSPCTIYNNFTNGLVTGVSRTSQGSYNVTTSTSINNYNCFVKASRNNGIDCEISSVSGTNNSVGCRDYATPAAQDTSFTLYCHGSL